MSSALPNWVQADPKKNYDRLVFEAEMLAKAFPGFSLMTRGDELFAEGYFVTHNMNRYLIRAWYPENYPYAAPVPVVCDADVVEFCKERAGHSFHQYGFDPNFGGIRLCIMKSDGSSGQGWEKHFSVVTVLNLAAIWLHAYEVKRATGEWILPEA